MKWRRWLSLGFAGIVGLILVVRLVPQSLIWPYHEQIAGFEVFASEPISPQLVAMLESAKSRAWQRSGYAVPHGQKLFLSDGGWRWNLLALRSRRAFAINLPVIDAIVINRSDQRANRISVKPFVAGMGGVRTLGGTLTHELTHGFLHRRFGLFKTAMAPTWLVEGYCDYVADESTLTAADVSRLRATGQSHPALVYYGGREKITRMIEEQKLTITDIIANY
jgi:hypothetical protein